MLAARATLAAPAAYEVPEPVSRVAKAQITPAALRAPIRILASDEFEGRGPATRGDALARLYLSTELETLGYQPGGANGSWEQPFDIVGIKAKLPATWDFTAKGGSKVSLRLSDDYVAGSGVHFSDQIFGQMADGGPTKSRRVKEYRSCSWLDRGLYVNRHGRTSGCARIKNTEAFGFGAVNDTDVAAVVASRDHMAQQIRAGEHEPIAVVAVEVPRAGAAVDDRLEGAKPALGGCGAP